MRKKALQAKGAPFANAKEAPVISVYAYGCAAQSSGAGDSMPSSSDTVTIS